MKSLYFTITVFVVLFSACGESKTGEETTRVEHVDSDSITSNSKTTERMTAPPKIFYYDYTEKRGTEDAIEMSQDEASQAMKDLPAEDGNFFGMELSDGKIVQFMYDGNKSTWFLDIPNPVTQESYNADISLDDALNIISDIFGGKTADDIQQAYK